MSTVKTQKFAWNETNGAEAVELYNGFLTTEGQGVDYANTEGLKEIMKTIGAPSLQSVRAKLTSAKAYQKSDKPRKVGGGTSVRKAHYVRVFAKHAQDAGLIDSSDDFASLESVKLDTLEAVAKLLDVSEEVKMLAGE